MYQDRILQGVHRLQYHMNRDNHCCRIERSPAANHFLYTIAEAPDHLFPTWCVQRDEGAWRCNLGNSQLTVLASPLTHPGSSKYLFAYHQFDYQMLLCPSTRCRRCGWMLKNCEPNTSMKEHTNEGLNFYSRVNILEPRESLLPHWCGTNHTFFSVRPKWF